MQHNLSPSVKGVQNTMNKLNVLNVSDANKFAFIKGNRPTDEKAIKVKKDSISEHGILCPITAVNGEEVIKSRLISQNGC